MTLTEFEDYVSFRTKVFNLINDFHQVVKNNYNKMLNAYLPPEINDSNELAYRLWKNCAHIKDYNYLRGYVVLDNDTIICVTSNSYIQQFDGCKESEIAIG